MGKVGYKIFLLLLIATITIIWGNSLICSVTSDPHIDLFIANIINMLNPSWPLATLILGLLFIILFKIEISHLIGRIRKFQGMEFDPQQNSVSTSGISQALHSGMENVAEVSSDASTFTPNLTNPTIVAVENRIREDLNSKYSNFDDTEKLKATIYHYAIEKLNYFCETIYASIFGSQIKLLKMLKQQNGILKPQVEEYFSSVKQLNLEHYNSWDMNAYLNFLTRNQLIELNPAENKFFITAHGEHFLIWLGVFSRPENKEF